MSYTMSTCPDALCELKNSFGYCNLTACVKRHWSVSESAPVTVHCGVCDALEAGDTLYSHSSDDESDIYSAIRDIRFCPKCGKNLRTFQEKRGR